MNREADTCVLELATNGQRGTYLRAFKTVRSGKSAATRRRDAKKGKGIMNGQSKVIGSVTRVTAGFALAAVLASGGAIAQQKAPQQAPAQPKAGAAPAAAAPAGEPVMWVKLCEKAPVLTKDAAGKDTKAEKNICLTHHERLDGNTGMVLVSAAIRQVEGSDKQHLMVMVPLGMAIQPGLKAALYSKELWEKAQKNEKVDDAKLATINLKFSLCHPAGCTAELDLTKEVIDGMRGNAGLMIFSINANGQVIAFPVPLSGFGGALDGKPVDNAQYTAERKRLMGELALRQQAIIEEYKKQQAAGGGQQPAATPTAAPKAPPAQKK